jgi:hypothetical protein
MERTKNILPDRGTEVDVDAIKDHFSQREHALQTQHTSILAALTKQLEGKQKECRGLESRNQFNVGLAGEIGQFKDELGELAREISAVRIESLVGGSSSTGESMVCD